ncbi:MAG TPA: glycine cleavage system aminomethyltransferase GcvT [Thermoplasmata archaeon]|nr:glycine cleavage system aminomethyltransferase GcvT [Thermoplasmata archaeon]
MSAPAAPPPVAKLRESPLAPFHAAHGGHMVRFAGWNLPLYFTGILAEHSAVRSSVGLFDVSHMGIVTLDGASAPALVSRRTTADIARLAPGQCRYTFLLDAAGRIVDDLLVTRLDSGGAEGPRLLAVPNAAKSAHIVELFRQHRKPSTTIAAHNDAVAILAVQGPKSVETLERLFGWSLSGLGVYHGAWFPSERGGSFPTAEPLGRSFADGLRDGFWVSRTGYTGESGFELFVPAAKAVAVADRLVAAGVVPCGLGARDTLRLEKGYLLSGQDFEMDRTPLEARQDRFVDFEHPFVGRESLLAQKTAGTYARLSGLSVSDPDAIPRHGSTVLSGDLVVATVTSGARSPTLGRGIALAYLPPALASPGTSVSVAVRDRKSPAEVVRLPFLPSGAARREYTAPPT